MNRDLSALQAKEFDCVVIGGGIAGTTFAREMAVRGASVAVLEQVDVGYGTTAKSTRLIHGGLRYLELFDFALVREDLRERELLFKNAPHLVQPLQFLTPVYNDSPRNFFTVKMGMVLYDVLSYDKSVPNHQAINAREAVRVEPQLSGDGLKGALLYYDGQCRYPERLSFSYLQDAVAQGAMVANHCRVVGLEKSNGRISGVRAVDKLTGEEVLVRCKLLVNAAGPWVDSLAPELGIEDKARLRLTKGVHIVVPKFTDHAIVLMAKDSRRIFFVIPWNGYSLVGTTDTDFSGDPATVRVEPEDIEYLRRESKRTFPHANLNDIKAVTAGLRPLVRAAGAKGESQTSRKHAVVEHAGINAISILGVKITNARFTALEAAEKACHQLGITFGGDVTKQRPLPGGNLGVTLAEYNEAAWTKHGKDLGLSREAVANLVMYYGTEWVKLLPLLQDEPKLAQPLVEGRPELAVQVRWAVTQEMAQTVSDVLLRRVPSALSGEVPDAAVQFVVDELTRQHGWDAQTAQKSVAVYREDEKFVLPPA